MVIDPEITPMSVDALKQMSFDLPRLDPDSPKKCPCKAKDIERYASAELAGARNRLTWVRTADVDDVKYWVWQVGDDFVYVEDYEGSVTIKSQSSEGLPVEAFIVREYLHNQYGRRYE